MSLSEYLKEVGAPEPLIEKSRKMLEIAKKICPENIDDHFISESYMKNGERVFESLWFFSRKFMLESKRMMSKLTNIDIMCHFMNIDSYEIKWLEYDPTSPEKETENSRLSIEGILGILRLEMKASGSNCPKLWAIIGKYIVPNIVKMIKEPE